MIKLIDNWIFKKSPQRKMVETIKRTKRKYPSMRVVGRGTLVISPKEIRASESFKHLQARISKLKI